MPQKTIRPIVICVFRDSNRILVSDGYDSLKQETFYRPLGGGIEFGERAEEAITREVQEGIGLEAQDLSYLGMLQNLFTLEGEPGHEIVLVYDGRFADESVYRAESIVGVEDTDPPSAFTVVWKHLSEFGEGKPPLYPAGLLDLLGENPSTGT